MIIESSFEVSGSLRWKTQPNGVNRALKKEIGEDHNQSSRTFTAHFVVDWLNKVGYFDDLLAWTHS